MKLFDLEVLRELSNEELLVSGGGLGADGRYKNTSLSEDKCVAQASLAMIKVGLSPKISGGGAVHAYQGDNVVVAHCIDSKNLVYFYAAGSGDTAALNNAVISNF